MQASRFHLTLALSLILILGIGASVLVYLASQRIASSNHELIERALADVDAISIYRSALAEHERLAYELYAAINAEQFAPLLLAQRREVESRMADLAQRQILSARDGRHLEPRWQAIIVEVERLITNIAKAPQRETNWDAARDQLKAISGERRLIDPQLDAMVENARSRAAQVEQQNRGALELMSSLVTAYTAVILLIAMAVAWVLQRLFQANRKNQALAQFPARNPMPVLTVDKNGVVQYRNQAAVEFVARAVSQQAQVDQLVPPEIMGQFIQALEVSQFGKIEAAVGQSQLAYHWYWLPDRQLFHIYLRDVSSEREAEEQLQRMAFQDQVTGLMNRNAIFRHTRSLLQRQRHVCLCLLTIERFHLLPSSLGFEAAESILASFGQHLVKQARDVGGPGVAVARIEGAMFALCWELDNAQQSRASGPEMLLRALPRTIQTDRAIFHASYCMGVTFTRGLEQTNMEAVFSDADAALRSARKTPGCDFVVHDSTIRDQEQDSLIIEQKLRWSIANGGQGLALVVQPKVALSTRRIIGVEALLRWDDAELGSVPPDRFVSVAEQSGLILQIGQWVSDKALGILRDWQREPALSELHMAINVSAYELAIEGYSRRILDSLDQHRIPPDRLQIEVTEYVLADTSSPACIDNLAELRRAGVGVSIDDFGTGYSSLAYLSTMPISQIKIDKKFVERLPPQKDRADLVGVIVDIARELKLECVAEGVESALQAGYLAEIGCQFAQGYHFARPMQRELLEAQVRSQVRLA